MRMNRSEKKKWQRAYSFFTVVAQAGGCEEWALSHENSADLSSEMSAFFIFNPNKIEEDRKMRRLNRRGQSALEYVIILTAIIAAILLAVPLIRDNVRNTLQHATNEMHTAVTSNFNF